MQTLRFAALVACLVLPLGAVEALAANAGVTAAVNQSARSTPPGGGVRTVVLGANVVQDEKIETDGAGLVQILLADGTTFTVGPNSSLTIDKFVYDPDANTAQVAASLGRGVFRFIGGRTSKTEGGVQLNTPVGTVGIRGGMADLNFTGSGGNVAQIDLLFGNEVTLGGPGGEHRVFNPGYSIIIGTNGSPTIIKTPPGSANFIQQALAGRPGSNGGNPDQPDDEDVANSGIPDDNSGNVPPQDIPPPDLNAIDLATPKPNDNHQVAENTSNQASPGKQGFSSGILYIADAPDDAIGVPLHDTKGDTRIDFAQNGDAKGGKMAVAIFGADAVNDDLYDGQLVARVGEYPSAPSLGIVIGGDELGSVSGVDGHIFTSNQSIIDCDCVQWGTWDLTFGATTTSGSGELTMLGHWITGDLMTTSQYGQFDTLATQYQGGTVYYEGIAKGYGQYADQYNLYDAQLGQGTMTMSWNFGTDSGSFYIDDFQTADSVAYGNHSFSAFSTIDRKGMSGGMFGTASDQDTYGVDSDYLDTEYLSVSGSFMNDGTELGAAVGGSFSGLDSFTYIDIEANPNTNTPMYFSVSGIFAGDQGSSQ